MGLVEYKDLLATSASVCTILQFLTGVLICQKIVRSGTVGETSAFPFVAGFLSCSLWLRYGFLLNDNPIILVNTVGAALQLAYIVVYSLYCTRKLGLVRQVLGVFLVLLIVLSYLQYETDIGGAKQRLGMMCCIVTLIFIGAPLTMLAHVIRVKSTESLPFSLIFASFIVSLLWGLYGTLLEDPFIQIPNALGCLLSFLQLLLFVCYPSAARKGAVLIR